MYVGLFLKEPWFFLLKNLASLWLASQQKERWRGEQSREEQNRAEQSRGQKWQRSGGKACLRRPSKEKYDKSEARKVGRKVDEDESGKIRQRQQSISANCSKDYLAVIN